MKRTMLAALLALLFPFCSFAGETDGWAVEADVHTGGERYGEYYGVTLGNGCIGIMPWKTPFSIEQVILGNVYDQNKDGISLAVLGINPFVLDFKVNGRPACPELMHQSLDMRRAVHSTSFEYDGAAVSYEVRALRNMPYAGSVSVKVSAISDVHLDLHPRIEVPDGQYGPQVRSDKEFYCPAGSFRVSHIAASTLNRGYRVSASSSLVLPDGRACPESVDLKAGEEFDFILFGTVVSSRDFIDPENESDRQVIYAVWEGLDVLKSRHEAAWEDLWRGDIRIDGDSLAQQAVRMALYHLYSFAREGSRLSIPPFGLSAQGYYGHIFWDTEIWMYPPMLFLNPGIAASMVDYRIDCLQAARRRAFAYGYRGAMFPWESDGAGEESCPLWAYTGPFEHHITADVGIAAWNFYRMYGDKEWLRSEGWPLISSVADFWVSRAVRNTDGSWSVRNVVCADEYAEGVDDNAFTNGAAIKALQAAVKAAGALGLKADPLWSEVASGLRILHDGNGVTMEYEGYDGRKVKQADVNLLAYPLGLVTDGASVRRDLEYYESRIDPYGPAMSFSILALQYARLGEGAKAYELFKRSYDGNRLPPFDVLSECAGAVNPYFTTGAGGMLQCVINGFGGLELTDKGIKQLKSALPPHWRSLEITGVGPDRKTYRVVSDKVFDSSGK